MAKIENGNYWGVLQRVESIAGGQKADYLEFTWEINSKHDGENWIGLEKSFPYNCRLYLSDKAMKYTTPRLEASGWNGGVAEGEIKMAPEWYTDGVALVVKTGNTGFSEMAPAVWDSGATPDNRKRGMSVASTEKLLTAKKNAEQNKKPPTPPPADEDGDIPF